MNIKKHVSDPVAVHCGYLCVLVLWAELAAGRPVDDVQSVIDSLQEALQNYNMVLRHTVIHLSITDTRGPPIFYRGGGACPSLTERR